MDIWYLLYGFHYPLDIINVFQISTAKNTLYRVTVTRLNYLSIPIITLHKSQIRDKHEKGLFLNMWLYSSITTWFLINHIIIIFFHTKLLNAQLDYHSPSMPFRHSRWWNDSYQVTTRSWVHIEVPFTIEHHNLSYSS